MISCGQDGTFRVATLSGRGFNMTEKQQHICRLLNETSPDILAVEETKVAREEVIVEAHTHF